MTEQLTEIKNNLKTKLQNAKNKSFKLSTEFELLYQEHATEIKGSKNPAHQLKNWMNGKALPKGKVAKECISSLLTKQPDKYGEILIPSTAITKNLILNITKDLTRLSDLPDIYKLTRIINNAANNTGYDNIADTISKKISNNDLLQCIKFQLLLIYSLQNKIFNLKDVKVNNVIKFEDILNLVDLSQLTQLLRDLVCTEDYINENRLERQVLIYLLNRLSGIHLLEK